MNPNGMALPDSVQLDQVMRQNDQMAKYGMRGQALQLAISLASVSVDNASSSKVLINARRMAHFIETGQVPAEAAD